MNTEKDRQPDYPGKKEQWDQLRDNLRNQWSSDKQQYDDPQNKKHTPEPWFQSHREGKDGGYRTEIYDNAGETIATLTWYARPQDETGAIGTYREANAKRIISCVNALEGIEDPEGWIRDIKKIYEDTLQFKEACESINPDNPMAVAENLKNLIKDTAYHLTGIKIELDGEKEEWANRIRDEVSKIEGLIAKLNK